VRNFRKDGTVFYSDLTVFPLPSKSGSSLRYVGIKRDVTEKMQTEMRLVESERRFRHLFTDNRLPMVLIDSRSGLLMDANPAATEFYGYSREELRSRHLRDLLVDGGGATVLARPGRTGNPFEYAECSQRHRLAGGDIRDVLVYSGELLTGEGSMRYAIVVDVTPQREAEERLRSAMEAARAASVAKSEFLQVVGHEIRTPLNVIAGFASLLEVAENEEERTDSLQMVLQGTRQLIEVLEGVVDYIGWNSELDRAEDVEVTVGDFARQCEQHWRVRADAKGLVFKIAHPDGEEEVLMPATDYLRIVSFLLDNAVKFTARGRVTLDCRRNPPGDRLIVRVTDTGIGIEAGLAQKLFSPFCSGDEGTQRSYGGIGLGLARCQRMAQAYGGEVRFQSLVGEGSTFIVELPVRRCEPPGATTGEGEAAARLLVIDGAAEGEGAASR
jgi:PAS domain S-box-containing protein